MRKECDSVKKSLRRYIKGHLFRPEQKRVERHLAECPLCNSEYHALKRILETQQLMRAITPPEGVSQKVKSGMSRLTVFTKLLYRPLWLLVMLGTLGSLYLYIVKPLLHDPDLERLEAPPAPAAIPPASPPASSVAAAPIQEKQEAPAPAAPQQAPLEVTISVQNGQQDMNRLNGAMKEHAVPGKKRFSETTHEISAAMPARELLAFLDRIDAIGKVRYKRSRLANTDSGEMIPFILRLKTTSVGPSPSGAQPVDKPVENPADKPVENTVDNADPRPAIPAAPAQ